MAGVFSSKVSEEQVRKAEGFARTPNMNEPGRYDVRIVRHSIGSSQRNENKIKFVCEYEIVKTAHEKHPVGCRRSMVVMIDPSDKEKTSSKLGAIKVHLSAVSGLPQSDITGEYIDELAKDPHRFEGTDMILMVEEAIKLKSGNDFTPTGWFRPGESVAGADETEDEDADGARW